MHVRVIKYRGQVIMIKPNDDSSTTFCQVQEFFKPFFITFSQSMYFPSYSGGARHFFQYYNFLHAA